VSGKVRTEDWVCFTGNSVHLFLWQRSCYYVFVLCRRLHDIPVTRLTFGGDAEVSPDSMNLLLL
jgi:hypothetical protein